MALAYGSSTSFWYPFRYPTPVRISTVALPPATVVAVRKRVPFTSIAETLQSPTVSIEFEIPYATLDMFLRFGMFPLARRDTPPAHLVLNDVPAAALPAIRMHIESTGNHVKIDYSSTNKKLIISCASREHQFMSNFGPEIMGLVTSNDNAFTDNDPKLRIVENGDCEIPLADEKHGRQPDGGLRLLHRESHPPFLIWEVLDSQPLSQMIEKISHYFSKSNGRIRIVIVIQLIRQRPPANPKRKRRPLSIGDESDDSRSVPTPEPQNTIDLDTTDEPVLPQLPPPGRLIQGFYWVYKHGLNAEKKRVIQCLIRQQEFYPTPPVGVLTLTWADILTVVPPHLSAKSLDIPFSILHDRFQTIVGVAVGPEGDDEPEPELEWDLSSFLGIMVPNDLSDFVSDLPPSDDREDGSG